MRPTPVIAAALATALLALGACSDDSQGSPSPSDSASASGGSDGETKSSASGGTTVDITIKDGRVTPNGERIKVKVGEPVTLRIDADTAGEIHAHSTPEQELEFDEGTSTKKLTIRQPGIVDVEDHALEQVIVQLEVS
jgi:hypothetical protein